MNRLLGFFLVYFLTYNYVYAVALDAESPKTIKANKIEYNVKTKSIATSGKTEITNVAGQKLTLTGSKITDNAQTISGQNIELWLGPRVYVKSSDITRDSDITIANNAVFTACNDCDKMGNAWSVRASSIKHDNKRHELYFTNPVVWIYDTAPVFWFPYYEMPDPSVKHRSGFLTPDLQSTNNMGTRINLPLYIALSDTHDFTTTLSYLTKENPLFQFEHRLNISHGEFKTSGSYTHNKEGKDRWGIFHDDVIELGDYARASVFIERVSDKTYLQKYGFDMYKPYLDSGAKLEVFGQSGYAVADAHVFQTLKSGRYSISGDILPNVHGIYQTDPFFNETYALFTGDVLGVSGDNTSMQRVVGDARIVSPWTLWGGNRLTLSADVRYDLYNFNKTDMIDGSVFSGIKTRFLPSGYIEWGLPLYKPSDNWTHIIEPRARLTIMRKLDNEVFMENNDSAGTFLSDEVLFSDNRFSGYDLWENGTFADYGMQWSAFNTNNNVSVFLGQSYDITERADTDPLSGFHNGMSDFVGRIEYNTTQWFDIKTRFRLSQQDLSLHHIESNARIGTSHNYINVGHMWTQQLEDLYAQTQDIHELIAGFGVQMTDRLSARFNAIYNVASNSFQRHYGGLFYDHPCFYLALTYKHDNAVKGDYVGDTTFQFKFGITIDGQKY
ncbi:MAG: LPS-assembly protein LptD [Proteobacteria bacterium]|nr:LPS-assembly protein LptD [Candidatus Enterousia scatequi]